MPKIKLTERSVEKLRAPDPSGKQQLFWDAEIKGFGVLVSGVTNAKTFIVQRAIKGNTRRVTVGATNVLTLAAARTEAERILGNFYRGIDPKARSGNMTLRTCLDAYLTARGPTLKEKTAHDFRVGVERHLESWLDLPLRDITGDMVEARHRSLQQEIAARGRHAGKGTANLVLGNFGTLWGFAAERDPDLGTNPVQRLKRQWFPIHRRETLVKADDLPKFYSAVMALESSVQRDYLLLLLFTGLRRTEAATLTWDAVDFANRVVRISAQRTKSGRRLDLPMTTLIHDLFVARRAVGDASKYLFPGVGKAGHVVAPRATFAEIAAKTGIAVGCHDLRRTFITVAESCDISPIALKALVNHSVGGDITGGYVVMSIERLRQAAERVGARMMALCGIDATAPANVARLR
jgi:integrase